jgi:hypothetical protein
LRATGGSAAILPLSLASLAGSGRGRLVPSLQPEPDGSLLAGVCEAPSFNFASLFFIVFNFVDAMWRFSLCYRSVARFRRVQFCSKMHFCHSGPRRGEKGGPPFSGLRPVPFSMVRFLSMPERNMENTTIRGRDCRYFEKIFCLLIPMLSELKRGILQRCGRRLHYLKKVFHFLPSLSQQ